MDVQFRQHILGVVSVHNLTIHKKYQEKANLYKISANTKAYGNPIRITPIDEGTNR